MVENWHGDSLTRRQSTTNRQAKTGTAQPPATVTNADGCIHRRSSTRFTHRTCSQGSPTTLVYTTRLIRSFTRDSFARLVSFVRKDSPPALIRRPHLWRQPLRAQLPSLHIAPVVQQKLRVATGGGAAARKFEDIAIAQPAARRGRALFVIVLSCSVVSVLLFFACRTAAKVLNPPAGGWQMLGRRKCLKQLPGGRCSTCSLRVAF